MFRPDVEGNITLLNFLKACDKVYRRLRLFRASVVNSNHLDDALEMILNCVFYVLMICLILVIYSIDPTKIFLATTSLSVSLSFAIGNASSKWFEVSKHCNSHLSPFIINFVSYEGRLTVNILQRVSYSSLFASLMTLVIASPFQTPKWTPAAMDLRHGLLRPLLYFPQQLEMLQQMKLQLITMDTLLVLGSSMPQDLRRPLFVSI